MNKKSKPEITNMMIDFSQSKAEKTKQRNIAEAGSIIRKYRLARGLNQPMLAELIGVSKNAISNWEAGLTRPDFSTISKLCRALQISSDTFFGLSIPVSELSIHEYQHIKQYRSLSDPHRKAIDVLTDTLFLGEQEDLYKACRKNYARRFELSLPASAGIGEHLTDEDERTEIFLRDGYDVGRCNEVIRVSGDSMCPTFCDGDKLMVEHTSLIYPGEIGIFIISGEGYVKEYQLDGLHSHNPAYKTIHPTQDDNFRCVGRVLGKVTDDMLPSTKELSILQEIHAENSTKK